MKLKDNLLLREVAGMFVVVAAGSAAADFNGILTLNESGAALWRQLEEDADRKGLVDYLLKEYNVDKETASKDVDLFLEKLRAANCLQEN